MEGKPNQNNTTLAEKDDEKGRLEANMAELEKELGEYWLGKTFG